VSAKHDVQIGVHAIVYAPLEDVRDACARAAAFLGNRARTSSSSAKITVQILPGLVTKISHVSPTVGITLRPGKDGAIVVDTRVEQHRTLQQRIMLIPVGPKRLVGKASYMNLLTSLEQELKAVNRGKGVVERTVPIR
jgi:hypothetical protein